MRDPSELLALVPYQLGFAPRRSLVLLGLRGPRRRVGLVARVDLPELPELTDPRGLPELPDPADPADPDPADDPCSLVAARLVDHMVRDGAGAVVAVVYCDHRPLAPGPQAGGLPGRVVAAVRSSCTQRGVVLLDAWWVDGQRFGSLTCAKACCPAAGEPLSVLGSSLVAAEMVSRGVAPAPSRGELLADLAPVGPPEQARARAAADAWRRRGRSDDGRRVLCARRDALALARVLFEGRPPTPAEAGLLAASLADPLVRDAVLLCLLPGSGDLPERVVGGDRDPRAGRLLDGVVGTHGPSGGPHAADPPRPGAGEAGGDVGPLAPEPDVVAAGERVLVSVVRHLPGPPSAQPLAVLAFLAWWRGDGARGLAYAERALAACAGAPGPALARLVLQVLDGGLGPAWVRAR